MNRLDPEELNRSEDEMTDLSEFQQAHRSFSDRVERFLMQLVILGLVILALIQTLHTNSTARRMLNLVEGLEGIPWNQVTAWRGGQPQSTAVSGTPEQIMLTVVSMTRRSVPEAKLLVDGKPAGAFASGSVTVPVRAGQVVAIDSTGSAEELSFRVVGPPGLTSPSLGATVTTRGDSRSFGVVLPAR